MPNEDFLRLPTSLEIADPRQEQRPEEPAESILARGESARESAEELDMTPMIDCVFLLLIFFVMGAIPDFQTEVPLPPARHGVPANPRQSVFITVAERGGPGPAKVYLADGKVGDPLPDDPQAQRAAIVQAVQAGRHQGKTSVILKAERTVRHAEVSRIAEAASQSPHMKLYLAVLESD